MLDQFKISRPETRTSAAAFSLNSIVLRAASVVIEAPR